MSDETPELNADGDEYGADQIQALEGIEGIRLRPAMYIGGTDLVGLHHLIFEVTDNVLDEYVNGHASTLTVTIHGDGSVTVVDDGRGIPVGPMPDMNNRSALEVVFTEIHAGGKFDRKAYATGTGGLHGVGLTAVNACSEWLEPKVRREGHVWTIEFARGEVESPLTKLGATDQTGTRISFKPDPQIFPNTTFNYDTVHKRLQDCAFLNAGIRVFLKDERSGQSDEFYYEDGLTEFVKYLNRTENPVSPDVIRIQGSVDATVVDVALQWNDGFSENTRCYANGIYNPEGGTHMSGFRTALTRTLNAYGKKSGVYKDSTPSGEDFREGLAAVVTVRIPNPQFESQTKIKLTNAEVEGVVNSVMGDSLNRYFEENPAMAKAIATKGLRAAEAREAARKARDLARDKSKVTSGGLPEKLRDCRNHALDVSELYLVEGDSAGGSADTGRDSANQAILPLRGKILNVEKAQLVKILANNEVAAIFRAIGISPVADEQDVEKRRYGKIILMTDADIDGSHIRTLLLTFIFRHMRELVKQRCIYIAQPPLYRVVPKGRRNAKPRYVQTHEEMMSELLELGLDGSVLTIHSRNDGPATADGNGQQRQIADEELRALAEVLELLQIPLETLERRGIELRTVAGRQSDDGRLPRFRVFLGADEHWLGRKSELDEFLSREQAKAGRELTVADEATMPSEDSSEDGTGEVEPTEAPTLQVTDLHEVRAINAGLKELRERFHLDLLDLLPAPIVNAEQTYPYEINNESGARQMTSLRELVPMLRKIGERGMTHTRFKGLGEMNPDELYETSMDPENRVLLQVSLEDAAAAEEIFRVLMGDRVEPRREFIEKHALDVTDLDV